uniref:Inhibitor of apoptosis protein-like protein n=1 Tax=Boltenia villosa TaxID=63515 RepID=Q8MVN1_BOLVI|nr:inhibitor of apoptosis protein-like protein [Boltenia villosa]
MESHHRPEMSRNHPIKPNHIPASTGGRQTPFSNDKDLMFPCDHPTNASFGDDRKRLQTFSNWPNRIKATPQEIAEAGFYYLGERDRCKCFYCNGGLQNWDKYDDPWMEHAKWFPKSTTSRSPYSSPSDGLYRKTRSPRKASARYPVTRPPCEGTLTESSPPQEMGGDSTNSIRYSPAEIDNELLPPKGNCPFLIGAQPCAGEGKNVPGRDPGK